MENRFEENDYEFDTVLDGLLGYLSAMQENTVKIIDFERYSLMMETAAELKEILADYCKEGRIDIEISEMFNLGSISIQLTELTITNIPAFIKMISKADNFDIYPKADGTIRLDITFQSVLKPL